MALHVTAANAEFFPDNLSVNLLWSRLVDLWQ
jgi:hypothetical protein